MNNAADIVIEIRGLRTQFGEHVVHDGIDLDVQKGEILGIVGGSGAGKSVLLRHMIMLMDPAQGSVKLLGQKTHGIRTKVANRLKQRFGVMFQQGALFSSLTVVENIAVPLHEHTKLSKKQIEEIALLKLALAGLQADAAHKYPSELSGGMLKRAAVARALALDPELIFLDEPSAGLDPVSAAALDELVLQLRDSLGLTVVFVSHDLDSLWRVTDRVAFLGEKKILSLGTMKELSRSQHPLVKAYFSGPRARTVAKEYR